MKSHMNNVPISEFAIVIGGYAFKSEDFTVEGIPVIKIKNIGNKKLSFEETDYLPHNFLDIPDKFKIKFGDVLISMTGSHITQPNSAVGRVVRSYSREISLLNQRVGKMQVNPKKCDLGFLYHYMSSDVFRDQIGLRSRGAANQANVSGKDMEGIPIPNFSLEAQQKIAIILSAYDDLIENNSKRIKLLEEMAQITYEEWFERLKFPGHETTPMDSETGLPVGWEKTTCFDLMDVLSGGTPKTDQAEYWDGNIKFFPPKDAANCVYTLETEKTITELGLKKCNSKLYPKNTIFITAMGTVGKLNLAREAMAMNQSCYALIAKNELSQLFLFCALNNAIGAFKGAANGGVFDAIVVDTFRYISIIKPDEELIGQFDSTIKPIFEQVDNLIKQNQLLKEARDILLPRLMTGMIDVEQLVLPESFSNTRSNPAQ